MENEGGTKAMTGDVCPTRDGRRATVLTRDKSGGPKCVVALIPRHPPEDKWSDAELFYADGRFSQAGETAMDLMMERQT
jgi:hypothetical protein